MLDDEIIKGFEEEHKITNIILLGKDGAIRNIEIRDGENE